MNAKLLIGITLGFAIGFACAWFGLPSPAPPALAGAVLVLAMTVGYDLADRRLADRPSTSAPDCGGPKGDSP